jgi:hypothetical protein
VANLFDENGAHVVGRVVAVLVEGGFGHEHGQREAPALGRVNGAVAPAAGRGVEPLAARGVAGRHRAELAHEVEGLRVGPIGRQRLEEGVQIDGVGVGGGEPLGLEHEAAQALVQALEQVGLVAAPVARA